MKKKIEIELPEGKVAEWQELDGKTILVAVDEEDNRTVTERIKTFEDAVHATGMKLPFDDNHLSCLPKDVVAYMKLRIIAAALNELNEETLDDFPRFTEGEKRWYPWFYIYTQEEIDKMGECDKKNLWMVGGNSLIGSICGLAYSDSYGTWSSSPSALSGGIAVKSESLARYFGRQFVEIWADYFFCKKPKRAVL